MPAKKPSGANRRANGRSASKLYTRASRMPARKPVRCPGEAHSDCPADASPPLLHDYLPTLILTRFPRAEDSSTKYFVIQSMPQAGGGQARPAPSVTRLWVSFARELTI